MKNLEVDRPIAFKHGSDYGETHFRSLNKLARANLLVELVGVDALPSSDDAAGIHALIQLVSPPAERHAQRSLPESGLDDALDVAAFMLGFARRLHALLSQSD